jgi:hypothetical protein
MRSPASEVSGAGPIATPAAAPMASIAAASIAVTRSDGRRGALGAGDVATGGEPAADPGVRPTSSGRWSPVAGVEVSDVAVMGLGSAGSRRVGRAFSIN